MDNMTWFLWVREWEKHRPEMFAEQVLSRPKQLQTLAALAMAAAKWHPGGGSPGIGDCALCQLCSSCADCPLRNVFIKVSKKKNIALCVYINKWLARFRKLGVFTAYEDDQIHEGRLTVFHVLRQTYCIERQRLVVAGEIEEK
jgi:hypothetical protein